MKPVIGINCAFQDEENPFRNEQRLLTVYVQAIEKASGLPLLLPIVDSEDLITSMIDKIDGLLMSGGGGLHPRFANSDKLPGLGEQSPIRHKFDLVLVQKALERNLPILGICRGHQTVNEAAGGTMHLSLTQLTAHNHKQTSPDDEATHKIRIKPGSQMASLLGTINISVNSFHQQAVAELAPAFEAVAWAEDGIIEAYESQKHRFVMGCQFHPESLLFRDNRFASIYETFVKVSFQE
ncbi:MAG: gamma-glutamyl-gamma-aminobutyrate hydrolase family protein [Desulfitobacteriaceae bacterium]